MAVSCFLRAQSRGLQWINEAATKTPRVDVDSCAGKKPGVSGSEHQTSGGMLRLEAQKKRGQKRPASESVAAANGPAILQVSFIRYY